MLASVPSFFRRHYFFARRIKQTLTTARFPLPRFHGDDQPCRQIVVTNAKSPSSLSSSRLLGDEALPKRSRRFNESALRLERLRFEHRDVDFAAAAVSTFDPSDVVRIKDVDFITIDPWSLLLILLSLLLL